MSTFDEIEAARNALRQRNEQLDAAGVPKLGGNPAKVQFSPEQWIVYSAYDLAVHMLTGQASQLNIAGAKQVAEVFLRAAQAMSEKRDKWLRLAQSGIQLVGADGAPRDGAA